MIVARGMGIPGTAICSFGLGIKITAGGVGLFIGRDQLFGDLFS